MLCSFVVTNMSSVFLSISIKMLIVDQAFISLIRDNIE